MLQVLHVSESESHGGHNPGVGRRGAASQGPADVVRGAPRDHADGACSSSSRLLGPAYAEREEGSGEGAASVGQGEMDEEGLQRYSGSAACFCRTVRYRPMKSYPLEVWVPTILKMFSPRVLGIESFMIALLKENKIE
jgi:hypothetical protein